MTDKLQERVDRGGREKEVSEHIARLVEQKERLLQQIEGLYDQALARSEAVVTRIMDQPLTIPDEARELFAT